MNIEAMYRQSRFVKGEINDMLPKCIAVNGSTERLAASDTETELSARLPDRFTLPFSGIFPTRIRIFLAEVSNDSFILSEASSRPSVEHTES